MIRLTILLVAAIGVAMLVGGRDLTSDDVAQLGVKPAAAEDGQTGAGAAEVTRSAASPAADGIMPKAETAAEPARVDQAAVSGAVEQALASDRLDDGSDAGQPAEVAADTPAPSVDQEIDLALADSQVWYVTGNVVNVRQGPSTDYSVVGQVVYGEATEILGDPSEPWVKIRIQGDGVEGFIASRFLTESEPNG